MEPLILILLCLAASFIISEFFIIIGIPRVIGPLLVGLVLGLPSVYDFFFVLSPENLTLLNAFAELGLIFFMFYIGLKHDISPFRKHRKGQIFGIFTALIPFLLGSITTFILFKIGAIPINGMSNIGIFFVSVVVGGCLALSSQAIPVEILEELKLGRTKIGSYILAAGVFDDAIEILLVAGLVAFAFVSTAAQTSSALLIVFEGIIGFILLLLVARFVFVPFSLGIVEKTKSKIDLFVMALVFAIFMAIAAEYFKLGLILGALLGGTILRKVFSLDKFHEDNLEHSVTELIKVITLSFFVPFLFIWIGMNASLTSFFASPFLAIVLTLVAIIGKVGGSMIASAMTGENRLFGIVVGFGLNARGAAELVAAKIALEASIIPESVFSALVFMTLFTTIVSPIVFSFLVKKAKT